MKSYRRFYFIAMLIALVGSAGAASAQPPQGGPGHGRGHGGPFGPPGSMGEHDEMDGPRGGLEAMERRFERMADELGLDRRRRAHIRRILVEARSRAEALLTQKEQARERLRTLMQTEGTREADVVEAARSLGNIKTDLRVLKVRTMFRIRELLTPAERARLKELREARMGQIEQACQADLAAHCPSVDDPREKHRCLRMHRERLSENCRQALPSRGMHRGAGRRAPRGRYRR